MTYGGQRGDTSPDWALEDRSDIAAQDFSYKDAKNLLYAALTNSARNERSRSLGKVFESLGHVIHHLQDMAQPQHVRNDTHCDRFFSTTFYPLPIPGICAFSGAYRPSAYETYTLRRGVQIPLGGYAAVDYGTFDAPRTFWENAAKGIAEFTSGNFVSIGTNFHMNGQYIFPHEEYPSPSAGQPFIYKKQVTDSDMLGVQGPNQPLTGEIWFVGTQVRDRYIGTEDVNSRTSTYSLFDPELTQENRTRIFTLNRFNYTAANAYLMPRAASYSIGMINYFFRGRIEIGLPSNGIYSAVDHAVTNAAGQGFSKFKVKLRNATPSATPPSGGQVHQEMSGGSLVAIAKYYTNPCYRPDLLGEYDGRPFSGPITPSGCTWLDYILSSEEIVISQELAGKSLNRTTSAEFTFDFSAKPIPINARDLSIQIVYRGTLGSESDAIVVSGKNISEPTYISVLNMSDYFNVGGEFVTPAEIRNSASLREQVEAAGYDVDSVGIDPEPLQNVRLSIGGVQLTNPKTLQPKAYLRVAVLSDIDPKVPSASPTTSVAVSHEFFPSITYPQTYSLRILPLQNQLARPPGVLSKVWLARGLPFWKMLIIHKGFGPWSPDQLDQLASLDPSCGGPVTFSCAPIPTAVPILFQ